MTGSWANSAVTYGYDEIGRVTLRGVNGVTESRSFDSLGRLNTAVNPLGGFTYSYDGVNNRLLNVALPNGQNTAFSYFGTVGDSRLQSIQNLKSDGSNVSTFQYSYDPTGQIQSWSQQADAQAPKAYSFEYDAVGQVLKATLTDTGANQVLKTFVYGYDEAGNRMTEQINGAITTTSYNNLNQLTGQAFSATPSMAAPSDTPAAAKAKPKATTSKANKKVSPAKVVQPNPAQL